MAGDFGKFLSELGNLHDCKVVLFEWKLEEQAVAFDIEDFYFNFEGLPEYRGALAGRIALEGVEHLTIDLRDIEEPLRIDEFLVVEEGPARAAALITFWPAGKIRVVFRNAIFPEMSVP